MNFVCRWFQTSATAEWSHKDFGEKFCFSISCETFFLAYFDAPRIASIPYLYIRVECSDFAQIVAYLHWKSRTIAIKMEFRCVLHPQNSKYELNLYLPISLWFRKHHASFILFFIYHKKKLFIGSGFVHNMRKQFTRFCTPWDVLRFSGKLKCFLLHQIMITN